MSWLGILAVVSLLLLNAVATLRLFQGKDIPRTRRLAQLAVIWLVPVVGPVVCLTLLATDKLEKTAPLDRTAFTNNADADGTSWNAPPGAGICGSASTDSGGSD